MKILLFLLALTYCSTGFSQKFYLQGGAVISNFAIEDDNDNPPDYTFDQSSRIGVSMGLSAYAPLGNNLSISSGLIYTVKGVITKVHYEVSGFGEFDSKNDLGIGYLVIPLNLSYRLNESVLIEAGPFAAIGVGGKIYSEESYDGDDEINAYAILFDSEVDFENASAWVLRRMDHGLNVGFALTSGEWMIKANYQYGLANIMPTYSDEILEFSEQPGYIKTRSFQISIGRRISFKSIGE